MKTLNSGAREILQQKWGRREQRRREAGSKILRKSKILRNTNETIDKKVSGPDDAEEENRCEEKKLRSAQARLMKERGEHMHSLMEEGMFNWMSTHWYDPVEMIDVQTNSRSVSVEDLESLMARVWDAERKQEQKTPERPTTLRVIGGPADGHYLEVAQSRNTIEYIDRVEPLHLHVVLHDDDLRTKKVMTHLYHVIDIKSTSRSHHVLVHDSIAHDIDAIIETLINNYRTLPPE